MNDSPTPNVPPADPPPAWANRARVTPSGWASGRAASPRIVVIGPCAAGKSSLVARLKARGLDASACAQEHSDVPYLWQLSKPDLVLFLDADRDTIGARRGVAWPDAFDRAQRRRLTRARARADCYIDSSELTPEQVAARAMAQIESWIGHHR